MITPPSPREMGRVVLNILKRDRGRLAEGEKKEYGIFFSFFILVLVWI
jgi:hypothetical protein